MKFPNLHIICTEGKNLTLSDLLSRTIDEEHFTKTRDITVEMQENINFFFAKTPFANNLECKYSICNNTDEDNKEKTHYPVLSNIHNNYFEINIDKNEYHPISNEKYNKETKTNLISKYKPKTKNWHSPIVEKDDLIIERNQKGPYTVHHDDDYLRLINNIKQEHNYDNAKITDIFYDEKTKITEDLIRETQIIDPVLHKVRMWKKHNNKPHSVTLDIRGNKGLFAYYRKFKSIIIDQQTGVIKITIRSEYINTELTHLCNYFEIKFKPSTTYAPWTNGLVEGTNRIIGQFIRTLLHEKYQIWSRKAKFFPYAYNTQY